MMNENSNLVFPDNLIIDVAEIMADFMEPYKSGERYDQYDHFYMKQVLKTLSPVFLYSVYFDQNLNYAMSCFADSTLVYSDETYDPSRLMNLANRVAKKIYDLLLTYGAYVNGVFPYSFIDLRTDMSMVLVHRQY